MGNKGDGFPCTHVKSKCCNELIRFRATAEGYSIEAWCPKCGNYKFHGRTEALIALWLGDFEAVKKNKGYTPDWVKEEK